MNTPTHTHEVEIDFSDMFVACMGYLWVCVCI